MKVMEEELRMGEGKRRGWRDGGERGGDEKGKRGRNKVRD